MATPLCFTRRTCLLPLILLLAATFSLPAQDVAADPSTTPAAKAPARIARLSYFTGSLQIQRTDNTAPEPGTDTAALNMPLPEGTRLVTGDTGQAEIEFEDGSLVRLTPHSSLALDSLTFEGKATSSTQLALLTGLAYFELRAAESTTYQIDAAGLSAQPQANSVLRIALEDSGPTFTALTGSVAISREQGFETTITAGQSLRPHPDDPTLYLISTEIPTQSWDAWNQSRDELAAKDADTHTAARNTFAGAQGYGWSDLDANGTWYSMPGPDGTPIDLWQPNIAAADPDPALLTVDASTADGTDQSQADATDPTTADDAFDPYDDGAFVWEDTGYTWASAYAWGWLPYRCGRWNWYPGFGWAWTPNRFCSVWGFGTGGILIGHHPPHYKSITFPIKGPGGVHPILHIHHPPTHPAPPIKDHPRPVNIAGVTATPLPRVPVTAAPGSSLVGQALYRDYPIAAKTHEPIVGTVSDPTDAFPEPTGGWVVRQSTPETRSSLATAPAHITRTPSGESELRPAGGAGHSAPAEHAEHHTAPPAAPVSHPAPAPAPAPAHSEPAAPAKPK